MKYTSEKIIQCECYYEVRCQITSEVISGKTYHVKRPKNDDKKSQNESHRTLFKIVEKSLRHRLQIIAGGLKALIPI